MLQDAIIYLCRCCERQNGGAVRGGHIFIMKKTSIHFNALWKSSVTFGGKVGVGQCGKNKGKGKGVKRSRGTAWFWGCLDEDRRH